MKRPLTILILLILNASSYGQANKLLRLASKTTDLNEKIDLYSKVLELEPKNLDAYFYRGLAKNDLGDYSGAIVDYSKIIVEEPDADTFYNRGNSRYSLRDYTGAQEDYQSAYQLDANFLDALYSLGCVKYDIGDFEGSIKDFTTLIIAIPNQTKFYYHRALAYIALEKYPLALNDYSLAILTDSSADSYYNRAVFYLDINYYDKAITDFSISLKLNENNSYAYFYRGTSLLFLGKYMEAITDFNSVLKFDALDFDAMLGLTICYSKLNDLTNAKFYFDKANSILSIDKSAKDVENYRNTYWYQNQFFFFKETFRDLSKL